jgi:hypothetical protein
MDFDENPGFLYYKAWAQKPTGKWYVNTSTGKEESRVMALLALLGLGCAFSFFAIKQRSLLFALISSAVWLGVIIYTRTNPIGSMVTGDAADSTVLLALLAAVVGVPLVTWQFEKRDREGIEPLINDESRESNSDVRRNSSSRPVGRETASEYEARLYRTTHPKKA